MKDKQMWKCTKCGQVGVIKSCCNEVLVPYELPKPKPKETYKFVALFIIYVTVLTSIIAPIWGLWK